MGDQALDLQGPMGEQMSKERKFLDLARTAFSGYFRTLVIVVVVQLVLASPSPAAAQAPVKPAPGTAAARTAQPSTPSSAQSSAPAAAPESLDRQPYRIELHLALDPSARIDHFLRATLLNQWQALLRRFVGPPWVVTVARQPSPLASGDLGSLEAEACSTFKQAFDKIWLVRISASRESAGLVITGREYDRDTRRLGPLEERKAFVLADAPRVLLHFALDLFNPTALITGQEGGRALLMVRGASVPPASDLGRVASKGTVFVPLRLVSVKDRGTVIRWIRFTYLQVESTDGPLARCSIVTRLRDPLTQRVSLPNTLAAIGVKPGRSTLRFRFLTLLEKAPAAGYTLTARAVPDGLPFELGMTDRAGRIALKPGFAKSLVMLRLVAGNAEPITEFPMMPGESSDERDIPVDPKPQAVAYQVKLDALRDEVIDLVALRARLEKRMEARLQGEDLEGLEQGLKEYALLPPRDGFAAELTRLKDQAVKQQDESKTTAILTKNLQAQFNELQGLIDRYLDNEAFTTYTDALQRKRQENSDLAKAKETEKPKRRALRADTHPAASLEELGSDQATPPRPQAESKGKARPTAKTPDVPF
jgi:hypothetical protein